MTRVAWWHCFAGIAGDMALASLLDAGADLEAVVSGLRSLPLQGWDLQATKVAKHGLVATQLKVDVGRAEQDAERDWSAVRAILQSATELPANVSRRAQEVFARLAAAEGKLHGVAAEEVHFHEVGSVDAIIDVVGTCLALEALGVSQVYASPVALGTGTVASAHGELPNPAPAVLELLAGVPVRGSSHGRELTTPTGAALLAGLAESFGPLPPLRLEATGYGAGSRDLEGMPNVLQVVLGELPSLRPALTGSYQQLVVLEANVDDVTGELLARTVAALMEAGALDAWVVPVVGKKGRPGHVVSALATPPLVDALTGILAAETGTLGLRQHPVERLALARGALEVEVGGHRVRVKVGPHRLKAEHDDCARAAARLGWPVHEVARQAEQAASALPRPPME
ncbi:MAG: nickel pincer cofactor biosynthesis protein LarC [Acidimicrobiales bacterium]